MTDLVEILERLGLSQYTEQLISEGFDSWETLCNIRESDLSDLEVKLGHRRKLQKAISDFQKAQDGEKGDNASSTSVQRNLESTHVGGYRSSWTPSYTSGGSDISFRPKRKYKRHPKPDANAPERPPSAYVLFSNRMREELKDQSLSFTEMAKIVGERWQILPSDLREQYEHRATAGKEKYNLLMSEYKASENYDRYQQYLAEFNGKIGEASVGSGKRPRIRPETSTETQSSMDSTDPLSPQILHTNLHSKGPHLSDSNRFRDALPSVASSDTSQKSPIYLTAESPSSAQERRYSSFDGKTQRGDEIFSARASNSHHPANFVPTSPSENISSRASPSSATKTWPESLKTPRSLPSLSKDPLVARSTSPHNSSASVFGSVKTGSEKFGRKLPTLPSLGLNNISTKSRPDLLSQSLQELGQSSEPIAVLLRASELASESEKATALPRSFK